MDRIHRLGQHRPVQAIKLVVEDSIESRIIQLQEKKSAMVDATLSTDDSVRAHPMSKSIRLLSSITGNGQIDPRRREFHALLVSFRSLTFSLPAQLSFLFRVSLCKSSIVITYSYFDIVVNRHQIFHAQRCASPPSRESRYPWLLLLWMLE